MNILMLAKNSEIGGLAGSIKTLAEGLERYRHSHTVVAIRDGDSLSTMLKDLETHIVPFESRKPLQILRNYRAVARLVKERKIDIIHAQNRIPAIYAAVYHFFHRKMPYIWANHQTPIPSGFLHRLMTFYGYRAVAEGEEGRKLLIRDLKIPADKVEVINLGVELSGITVAAPAVQEALKQQHGIRPGEKVILLYGRLDRAKGHPHLIEALKDLTRYPFKLVFPGENEPYRKELLRQAEQYGFADRLIFPGFIKGTEWLPFCNLMVLPSQQEGFGIANIECFSLEVPVIRTKTGGYREMHDLCFGMEYGDIARLETLLTHFFADDPVFRERAEKARQAVGRFSLEKEAAAYYDLYLRAIRAARGNRHHGQGARKGAKQA